MLLALALGAAMLFGQAVTGSLIGTVTDPTNAVAPNAKVTLTEVNTGIVRNGASNASGNYSFTNLDAGTYRVEIEVSGFRKASQTGLNVLVNSTLRADIELQAGTVTETVNVTAEVALLQTDRVDTGRKIETRQLTDMPLTYNRNFQGLLNLVPGAIRSFRPHSEFFNAQDSLSTRVNGQSRLSNNVQLEGIDNNHRTGLLTAMIPPIEALQAVDVTTSNYEAELGRAGGAVTNVTFKSGTNDLHGSVFHFNKVSRLGARSFFATRKPTTTYNLMGFTLGGPVRKNKTFFFGDFQGIWDRRGDNHIGTIPTVAFRNGDLSQGITNQLYDPATGNANGTLRQPLAGNQIPSSRISPIARNILNLIPAPNRGGTAINQNFEISTVRKKDTKGFDVKVDHQQTDRDRFSVRYSYQKPTVFDPPLYSEKANGIRDFAGEGSQKTHNGVVNYTRVWTPSLISEVRAGIMYYRNVAQNTDIKLRTATEIGIPGVNVSDFTGGISHIDISGYSNPVMGFSPSLPWDRGETNLNFVVNSTWIKGNHTVKFGVDYRRNRDELLQNQTFSPRGRFNFREGTTRFRGSDGAPDSATSIANGFASFLLDLPNSYGRDLPLIFPTFLQRPIFSYVQDKWLVSQKLTVDLGLRHEAWPPPVPRVPGGFSNYDPNTNSLVVAGLASNPMNMGRKNYLTNFAPRVGLAYRATQKTVFRAGYGLSWIPLVDNGYAFNFPVRENNAFNAPDAFQAAGTMARGFPAFVPFPIPSNGIIPNAPASNFNVIPLDVREAYIQAWNFTIQRQLPWNLVFDVAYVGNHGVGIKATQNLNAGLVPGVGTAGQPLFQRFGRTADTNNIMFGTSTVYNSLQVKLDRRFSGGFLMTTAYTWGKAIDWSGADNGTLWVHINPSRARARADGDRRHVFVQSYIYELPFGKGKRMLSSGPGAWILGGWQVNGILTLQTGEPFNLTVPASVVNVAGGGNNNTPDLVSAHKVLKQVGPGTFWFDINSYRQPAARTYGTLGRNILSGPGFANVDFSTFRKFTVTERTYVEFRFEAFNFTNTPHFNNPTGDITSPNFGRITGVNGAPNGPREIQFGLKVVF